MRSRGEQPALAESRPLEGELSPLSVAFFKTIQYGFDACDRFVAKLPKTLNSARSSRAKRGPLVERPKIFWRSTWIETPRLARMKRWTSSGHMKLTAEFRSIDQSEAAGAA